MIPDAKTSNDVDANVLFEKHTIQEIRDLEKKTRFVAVTIQAFSPWKNASIYYMYSKLFTEWISIFSDNL